MSLILSIAILLFIMILLLPYDIRWTAKLLRRDVRELWPKSTTRPKQTCRPVGVVRSASARQQIETEGTTDVPGNIRRVDASSEHVSKGSVYTKPPQDVAETSSVKCPSTLYELLEERLRATYACRDRGASHEDRWRFRGSWLLLYKAIQACRSNDSYDVVRDGARDASEKRMLLEMLHRSTGRNRSSVHRISKMPAALYARHHSDQDLYDSLFSNASTLAPAPCPAQIWVSILEATDDATQVAFMAEELLVLTGIWSDENSADMIKQIGDPHKKFSDAADAEVRVHLGKLLSGPVFMSSTP